MKTIEVKSCGDCPFKSTDQYLEWGCYFNEKLLLPESGVHPECELRIEPITVELITKP